MMKKVDKTILWQYLRVNKSTALRYSKDKSEKYHCGHSWRSFTDYPR